MTIQHLLTRNYKVQHPEGQSHRIKEIQVRAGQSLARGEALCSLEYKRKGRLSSPDTVYLAECAFDVDQHEVVEVLDIVADVGQEVPKDGCDLFSYIVPATLENALEPILHGLVTTGTDLHSPCSGIPDRKKEAAIEEYAKGVDPDRVAFLYDATVLGSGKTGFVITDSALYLHDDDASYEVRFNRIESWAQTEEIVRQDKGDSIVVKSLEISGGDQIVKIPHTVGMLDWARAGDFLDAVVALRQEGMTKDVDGFMAIEALPDGAKLAYIEAIMWLVHHDDGTIDSREFGELRLLMTQLGFSGELRRRTLTMLDDAHNLVLDQVLDKMKRQVPAGAERLISLSLIKDMVRIFNSANGDGSIESPQIAQARELLDVDEEQLQLIHDAAKFERDVFSGSVSSDDLQKSAEGLAAKAAAVGVPIAAVYMSGSVVGLSAAGMTSGLAALGLGGVLGLSSMATGVGVVVLLGIGVYSGIRRVVGGNKEKADAQFRDLMLQEVLRNHQKAIAALGEDLADLAQRIVELSRDVLENKLKIEKLGKEVMLLAEALAQVKLRGEKYEGEAGSSGDQTQDSEVGGAA